MKRNIVTIDPDRCNGCGLCVNACHEGALQLMDGKARLMSDNMCDGLGACLPECPMGAITIVEREAVPFDETAVSAPPPPAPPLPCGCPGKMAKSITRAPSDENANIGFESRLTNWPVQIKLVPVNAPYLQGAALLVAADCTAFAFPDIHRRFMANKVTLIGCPKLDEVDYTEKLTAILKANDIRSVTVLRMEVPCCAGIANAVKQALINSGKMLPWHIVTISTDGAVIDE